MDGRDRGRLSGAAALLAALTALAGCGNSSAPPHTAQASRTAPVPAGVRCSDATAATVARLAHAADAGARLAAHTPGLVTCDYRAGGAHPLHARVTVDTAAQVRFRFERAVVEQGQARLGAPRAQLPQVRGRVAWVASDRQLLTFDADRLVTVVLVGPRPQGAAARVVAAAIGRSALR